MLHTLLSQYIHVKMFLRKIGYDNKLCVQIKGIYSEVAIRYDFLGSNNFVTASFSFNFHQC